MEGHWLDLYDEWAVVTLGCTAYCFIKFFIWSIFSDFMNKHNNEPYRKAIDKLVSKEHYNIQAAIAAMQGMLANPAHHKTQVESGVPCSYFYAVNAVMCADDLINELQKKGEQQ